MVGQRAAVTESRDSMVMGRCHPRPSMAFGGFLRPRALRFDKLDGDAARVLNKKEVNVRIR